MSLPIDAIEKEIKNAARQPGFCILLSAPTGSGKSTRVPGMLMDSGVGERGLLIVVQPRRIAARLLASYVAKQFPCELGQEVGYAVRFDSKRSSSTKILFTTDGIMERMMTDNPHLEGVAAIVFDEAHERRLSGDLCLARALELQKSERPDIGIAVMSATLDLGKLQDYLPRAQVLRAEGRLYPVEISYLPPIPSHDSRGRIASPPVWDQCSAAVKKLLSLPDCGDILVFLPGSYEIRRTVEILENVSWMRGRGVFPLHGRLSPALQAQAVEPSDRPRVIVSTNIAETSLTIEGVRSVVDCGTEREARWDPRRGISTLHIVPIAQAQADQRAGRAGRLGPGRCIRLWSEAEHRRRPVFPAPEVHRADISMAFLNLQAWGYDTRQAVRSFPWADAPLAEESERAWQLLAELGAIRDQGGLTQVGRDMLRYPLPPILSRLIIAGREHGCEAEMAAIAAILQGESLALAKGLSDTFRQETDYTDFQAEWRAVEAARQVHFSPEQCSRSGIMARAAREIAAVYRQLLRRDAAPQFETKRPQVIAALLAALPDHVGVRRNPSTGAACLTAGLGGKVNADSVGRRTMIFLATDIAEVGGKTVETHFNRCTALEAENLTTRTRLIPRYDEGRKRVLQWEQTLYRDLILEEREIGDAPAEQAAPLLAEEVLRGRLRLERWDGHVLQWINRLACLRNAMPELELPSFEEDDKLTAVSLVCEGASSYKEICQRPVLPILEEWLSPWQRQALETYAPKKLTLRNGREVKLLYREDGTPTFSLKCQLLFGVRETPTIAKGNVRCLVEILAPNQRPYQLTSDLASFWSRGYPQMRKDLAGRYPKHFWPEQAPDAP